MIATLHKNFFQDLPSWEDVILDLNRNIQEGQHVIALNNLGFVTHFGERMEKVKPIVDHIRTMRPNEPMYTAHVYISLLSNSETFSNHKDETDVFFVLALGKMKWIIDDTEEHKLTAGDMLFIPKGAYHAPVPLSPRVGVSIGFN